MSSLDPAAAGRRSDSPESSGRDSPLPRRRGDDVSRTKKDKQYRKYQAGIERVLSVFETTLQEWADYISFLNRLLKVSICLGFRRLLTLMAVFPFNRHYKLEARP